MAARTEDRNFEFYDLTNDIGETVDLVENSMTQVQFDNAMAARSSLTNWLLDVDAQLLTVRATGESVPPPQHSPVIEFALGSDEFGVGLAGTTDGLVSSLGVSMNLTAEGSNGGRIKGDAAQSCFVFRIGTQLIVLNR